MKNQPSENTIQGRIKKIFPGGGGGVQTFDLNIQYAKKKRSAVVKVLLRLFCKGCSFLEFHHSIRTQSQELLRGGGGSRGPLQGKFELKLFIFAQK